MRLAVSVAILLLSVMTSVNAETGTTKMSNMQVADAATDACFANCASQSESCKRACPATFGAPCLSSCDSQAQTCRMSCRSSR